MEGHKQMLDKEYETLLTSFRKELEKLHVKHQQELERKVGSQTDSLGRFCILDVFTLFFAAETKLERREKANERD